MRVADLAAVRRVADIVHPGYPEADAVFAERLALCVAGCLLLERAGDAVGYLISHPWRLGDPPALDSLLGALPAAPDTWYLHDIALLDSARGTGAAAAALELLLQRAPAARLASLSLTAVNRSVPFWQRHGFERADDAVPARRLRSYGGDACYMVRHL